MRRTRTAPIDRGPASKPGGAGALAGRERKTIGRRTGGDCSGGGAGGRGFVRSALRRARFSERDKRRGAPAPVGVHASACKGGADARGPAVARFDAEDLGDRTAERNTYGRPRRTPGCRSEV